MTVTLQRIAALSIPGSYAATVQVGEEVHHFEITVTTTELPDAPGPLLRVFGDSTLYEILGNNAPSYPTILRQVARYHQGQEIAFPLVVQATWPT